MAIYLLVEEFKDRVDYDGTDSDDLFEALLEAASRMVDDYCNRPDGFYAQEATREFAGSGTQVQLLPHEFASVSKVEVKDSPSDTAYTEWGTDDYVAFAGSADFPDFSRIPFNGLMITATSAYDTFTIGRFRSRSGFRPDPNEVAERFLPTVRITAKWGYSETIPRQVREATATIAARWWKRGGSAWADTIGAADVGLLLYRQRVDPDVRMMLAGGRLVKPSY